MSTLDKDVYERLYDNIEQTILVLYLTGDQRRWRTFYKQLTEAGMMSYELVDHKDPQVSVEMNRRDCEHINVLITIDI